MINTIYETVRMIINTDGKGNFSPPDFNNAVNYAIDQIYDGYIIEINKFVNKANRGQSGSGYENIPERIREKINHYLKESNLTYAAPNFTLPTDLGWLDSIYYNTSIEIEPCKDAKEFKSIVNYIQTTPTANSPIYLQYGNAIRVAPSSIITGVSCQYIRRPLVAKWTFQNIGGNPLFNASAVDYQDIDIHASEMNNIIQIVLYLFGVNLSSQEVQQAANIIEAQEQNNENNIQ